MTNYGYLLKLLHMLGIISYKRRIAAAINAPRIIFLEDLKEIEAELQRITESGVGAHSGDE